MVFSSTIFLFGFLPLFLVIYTAVVNRSVRNVVLLLASLLFYAWGEPVYVLLMIASILVNWATAIGIANTAKGGRVRDVCLVISVASNLAILCFWKYEAFIVENVNMALGEEFLYDLQLGLPIGISFFTLQAISYVIDVYRGDVKAQKNPLYLGMYIAMFPQLVAGPIVRYGRIEKAIDKRHMTFQGFVQGLRLFIVGLGKKVLLANTAAILADSMLSQDAAAIGFVGCFSGVLAYTFQIYFDFSGYSDMAMGLGKMMGFDYPRNFNYPYLSKSATEFWHRWHISLGSFFTDYVYKPLGGNRVSRPQWVLNIFVVWSLTGIWHGAAWNFVLWGLYWGTFVACEKIFILKALKRVPVFVRHIYCIVLFYFGWLLFSVTDLEQVGSWFMAIFGAYGFTGQSTFWELQSWSYVALIPVMITASLPIAPWLRKRIQAWCSGQPYEKGSAAPEKGNDFVPPCQIDEANALSPQRARVAKIANTAADVWLLGVFLLSAFSVVSSSYNPFIYFQF